MQWEVVPMVVMELAGDPDIFEISKILEFMSSESQPKMYLA